VQVEMAGVRTRKRRQTMSGGGVCSYLCSMMRRVNRIERNSQGDAILKDFRKWSSYFPFKGVLRRKPLLTIDCSRACVRLSDCSSWKLVVNLSQL